MEFREGEYFFLGYFEFKVLVFLSLELLFRLILIFLVLGRRDFLRCEFGD